jgi:hypothetical protein
MYFPILEYKHFVHINVPRLLNKTVEWNATGNGNIIHTRTETNVPLNVKAELFLRIEYLLRYSRCFSHDMQSINAIPSFQEAANLPIMRHINLVPIVLFNMLKIYFNIILLFINKFSNWSLAIMFIHHKPLWIPLLFKTFCVYRPSHFPRFGSRNNIRLAVKIFVHLITSFHPAYVMFLYYALQP